MKHNKNYAKELEELNSLKRDLETLRELQRRHNELVALQKELMELKELINTYTTTFNQTTLEIIPKNTGE